MLLTTAIAVPKDQSSTIHLFFWIEKKAYRQVSTIEHLSFYLNKKKTVVIYNNSLLYHYPLIKREKVKKDIQTLSTESRKKNRGSIKMATRHDITKNLFHCWTTLVCGFIIGKYDKTFAIDFFAHPSTSPYRMLWNCKTT